MPNPFPEPKPLHQRMVVALVWVFGGIMAVGAVLDALSNSIQLITPRGTYVATGVIVAAWLAAITYVRRWGLPWVGMGGQTVRIRRMGRAVRWSLVGLVVVVWLPRIADVVHGPEAPFRISYYSIQGQAVDFVLAGQVDSLWQRRLSRQPYIIDTEVTRFLRHLRVRYDGEMNAGLYGAYVGQTVQGRTAVREVLHGPVSRSPALKPRPWTVVPGGVSISLDRTNTGALLRSVLADPRWRVGPDDSGLYDSTPASSAREQIRQGWLPTLRYYRGAALKDIREVFARAAAAQEAVEGEMIWYYNQRLEQQLALLERVPGADTAASLFSLEFGHDGHDGYYLSAVPPTVTLRVAVIENLGDQPLRLNGFHLMHDSARGIRRHDPRRAAWTEVSIPFGIEWLRPGESVMIPLSAELGNDLLSPFALGNPETEEFRDVTPPTRELRDVLGGTSRPFLRANLNGRGDTVISRTDFDRVLSREPFDAINVRYTAGPALTLRSIDVGGRKYPARSAAETELTLYYGASVGSCPYLAVRHGPDEAWETVGPIVDGRNSKARESWDSLTLPVFDGSVLLWEEELETTRMDYIALEVTDPAGRRATYPGGPGPLQEADGEYLSLNPGDSVVLAFPTAPVAPGHSYRIVAKGYYLPIRHGIRARNPRPAN